MSGLDLACFADLVLADVRIYGNKQFRGHLNHGQIVENFEIACRGLDQFLLLWIRYKLAVVSRLNVEMESI